jgi:NAD(P)-dependent dehydrogenase (short-subunit alcohol dehydrogenase family)
MLKADFDFKGKTAIVTGASRGIGKAIADLLSAQGAQVIGTSTKGDGALKTLDLADPKSVKDFISFVKTLPKVDILINNAGINKIDLIADVDDDDWDNIIKVNLTGTQRLMKAVASKMIQTKTAGRILNISSIFGIVSRSKRNAYSASKAGVIGLTKASALDLAQYGIMVNALCPGFVKTDMTASILSESDMNDLSAKVPLGRFAAEDEIAKSALFLCSELNSYMTGQTLVIDGGFISR